MTRSITVLALPLLALSLAGCDGSNIANESSISSCGGFGKASQALTADLKGDPATYCDAERLLWAYFPESQTLEVANNRIMLNCCGEHDIDVSLQAGVYVINETDAPEFGDARCGCTCVFDYTAAVDGVPSGQVDLRIMRTVTDSDEGTQLIWEGSIDTTTSTGAVEIQNNDVGPWCGSET